MGDLLRQGRQWLAGMRAAHLASQVTYRRDEAETLVNATFGKTDVELDDGAGMTIGSHVTDFLILADSIGLEPEAADVIVADGRKYEVVELAGDGCWRWSDPYRTTYRIHTRDIGPDA